ncbi:xylulose-5-phosphate/fructose-6-phosphate phosphoketolase [Catenulispora sp. MAP5-51]|uniref:phosphoketolase family protein n=1 Tax=Catenulispora sp. MAP5-51 TaxID=3156298 RepID=UPI00351283BB
MTIHAPIHAPWSGGADLGAVDRYWRAANYLSAGQIYLRDNALLHRDLEPSDIKPRLLGHWGTSPGLSFVHAHLNRLITENGLDLITVLGPGHGGPAALACSWLDGTYTDHYPDVTRDETGMTKLFAAFSAPGGVPSHIAANVPGSIHEGGELGYSLAHAFGAAFDNPDLIVACVVGDGEAETGPLAASWQSIRFLNPARDGAVLPILHLNGYKIANPTVLDRIPREQLDGLLAAHGWDPRWVFGDDPHTMHHKMAEALDSALASIRLIQSTKRNPKAAHEGVPPWPVIILRTPKGWTGPRTVDGVQVEGTFRSHQVPLAEVRENPKHRHMLVDWMKSYRPDELFDHFGRPKPDVLACVPDGEARIGANRHANGGILTRSLDLPQTAPYAALVAKPGETLHEPTRVLGTWLRDVIAADASHGTFRLFGPDETASNHLDPVFEVTNRTWMLPAKPGDDHLAPDGRVMEVLSEHLCQGWLEGYLLTGRHGLFSCYEAFIHIIDSMLNQHVKWLKTARALPWRAPVPSLNYLLTSHVWRQDHNGFSHQDPGFLDHVANKTSDVVRLYLPPDANTLLSVAEHCLRSRDLVNVIVAGKNPSPDWLTPEEAELHCARGLGIWEWAGTEDDLATEPDVVLACAGDVPTLEVLAASQLLREHLPGLRIRVVNVVDLMRLQPESEHPHGLPDAQFDAIFTVDKPIIFAFHGYPSLIHRLAYRRRGHANLHVRGYKEQGTTTTPFDMLVRNDMDRFQLVCDVIDRVPHLAPKAAAIRQVMTDARARHRSWIVEHGEDMPEIREWTWTS